MATPNPHPFTPQTDATTAPKRRRHKRHAQQLPTEPEEMPTPAASGRIVGLAPAPKESLSTTSFPTSTTNPTAPRGVSEVGQAREAVQNVGELLTSSCLGGRRPKPAVSAGKSASSSPLQVAESLPSGDLGALGRHGPEEGVQGLAGVLSDAAIPAMPGNAGHRNSARILPDSALQVLDRLPDRASGRGLVNDVPTVEGDVWEKGPETVYYVGNSIRAIYSPSHAGSPSRPGSGGAVQNSPANGNAVYTQRPGGPYSVRDDTDGRVEGAGRVHTVPDRSKGATACSSSRLPVTQPANAAIPGHLSRGANLPSCRREGLGEGVLQAHSTHYPAGVFGSGGGEGQVNPGENNMEQFWADCSLPAPDFVEVHAVTDSRPGQSGSRRQGGTLVGQMGFPAEAVWGTDSVRLRNSTPINRANGQQSTVTAASQSVQADGRSSVWGRPAGPGSVGGWSPDYREAFPSLRGDDEALDAALPREEDGVTRTEKGGESTLRKVINVKVIRNKQNGQSEGYGSAAEKVLQSYSNLIMPNTDQPFRLNWASFSMGDRRSDAASDHSIFVGDLASDVTDALLQETFASKYSSVKAAKVVIDAITGRSKGYGFVRFGNDNEKTLAMTEMNGEYCSSRPMRIGAATPRKSSGGFGSNGASAQGFQSDGDSTNTTVFVGGLDPTVNEEELKQSFSHYGEVASIKIPVGKQCGFVQFVHRNNAEEALQGLNGTVIGKQTVRLSWGRNPGNKQELSATETHCSSTCLVKNLRRKVVAMRRIKREGFYLMKLTTLSWITYMSPKKICMIEMRSSEILELATLLHGQKDLLT